MTINMVILLLCHRPMNEFMTFHLNYHQILCHSTKVRVTSLHKAMGMLSCNHKLWEVVSPYPAQVIPKTAWHLLFFFFFFYIYLYPGNDTFDKVDFQYDPVFHSSI